MIKTEEVKIKIPKELTSEYIDEELKKMGFDVLKWAIVDFDENYYKLNIAIVS